MKFVIKDIPKKGLDVHQSLEASSLGLLEEELLCLSPLSISGRLNRVDKTVLAHIDLQGKFVFNCSRCLEPIEKENSYHFDFDYGVEQETDSIDLGEDIRQELLMGAPAKILCQPQCKGLCARCGVNFNQTSCMCIEKINEQRINVPTK